VKEKEFVREAAAIILDETSPGETPFVSLYLERIERGTAPFQLSTDQREGGSGIPAETLLLGYIVIELLKPVAAGASQAIAELTKENLITVLRPYAEAMTHRLREIIGSKPQAEDDKVDRLNLLLREIAEPPGRTGPAGGAPSEEVP
jgi:hypothetical protein